MMLINPNDSARYSPVHSQSAAISASNTDTTHHVGSWPQWLYEHSISKQSLDALVYQGQAGSDDQNVLVQLFQRHLHTEPISLQAAPTRNNPCAVYGANVRENSGIVTIHASFAIEANHGMELQELRTEDGPGGRHVSVRLPSAMALSSSSVAALPHFAAPQPRQGQQNSSAILNYLLYQSPSPVELDRRQNDVAATRRESSWAVKMLQTLDPTHAGMFLSHVLSLIATVDNYKIPYEIFLQGNPNISPAKVAEKIAKFDHVYEIRNQLNEGARKHQSALQLIKGLVETRSFKEMLDLMGELLNGSNPKLANSIREQSFFTDRGRTLVRTEQIRERSYFNRHAGIADELHRRPSMENFFSREFIHAKSGLERDPNSETARRFSHSGVPFIGGASGSIQFVLQALEMAKPQTQRSTAERAKTEIVLLIHCALMVAAGHHSIVEVLAPGRRLGYFGDLPDPFEGRIGYKNFMQKLDVRMTELNINCGASLI